MKIDHVELLRLRIPFRASFRHALASRSYSDTLLVILHTENGARGFGEILARDYVTGESNDEIFTSIGGCLAAEVVGQTFAGPRDVGVFVERCLSDSRWGPAVFGGFELALWHACALSGQLDLNSLLGPLRSSPVGKCATIGLDCPTDRVGHFAMLAKMNGATTVKVKIGSDRDAERLRVVNDALKGGLPIRLDANGILEVGPGVALLKQCRELPIESLEQPFLKHDVDLSEKLRRLHAETAIPMVADESVCSIDDAAGLIEAKMYQVFNLRLGKQGGLLAAAKIRDMARANDIGLVAGTMVGESGVLNQAAALFLAHSEALDYIEGLGQNRNLLEADPVGIEENSDAVIKPLVLQDCAHLHYVIGKKEFH